MKYIIIYTLSICITSFHLMAQTTEEQFPPLERVPIKEFHMINLSLNFCFNIDKKELFGEATEKIVPLHENYQQIHLDAGNMQIESVTMNGKNMKYNYDDKELTINLEHKYNLTDTLTYTIKYSTFPDRGIFFVLPDSGYPDRIPEIWSQSEDEDAHYWYPCHDYPDDFSTSEMTITAPDDWVVVSNGALQKVETDKKDSTKTFYWVESVPHVVYLNSIVAGKFKIVKDHYGKIPVYYYVPPKYYEDAKEDFKYEPDILKFYSMVTGYQYPWEKLSLSTVNDFTEGGMENASAITLESQTLHDINAEPQGSSISLIAHETAHQWFGDLLTCRSWSNAWLNEGFATFFETLYQRHLFCEDYFSYETNNNHDITINEDNQRRQSTYYFRYKRPDDVFSDYIYQRGASILNMIRGMLGDSLFFKAINHYVHEFQHKNVDTRDFQEAIQEATGKNLDWFFDEWVYKGGHPKFDVNYTYDLQKQQLTLDVSQTQKVDSLTPVYRMPVGILIETSKRKIDTTITVDSLQNKFEFQVPEKPLMVNFDEDNLLIKEMNFKKSEEELAYQLKKDPNATGRMWASDQLAKLDTTSAETALINALENDEFWGVREECAENLGRFITTNSETALISTVKDKDERVQEAAINSLANFNGGNISILLKLKFHNEDNPYIKAAAVRSLASVDSSKAMPEINEALGMESYRGIVRGGAIAALSIISPEKAYAKAAEYAKYGYDSDLRERAITEIEYLNVNSDSTLQLLEKYGKDPYIWVRRSAYYALGRLRDKRAIPFLKERVDKEINILVKEAAERAIKEIE
jgi:aminopeptidase N